MQKDKSKIRMDKLYKIFSIVFLPVAAISVSLFPTFFSEKMSLSRGIVIFISFLLLSIITFLILNNKENMDKYENEIQQQKGEYNEKIKGLETNNANLENDLREHTKGLWRELGYINKHKREELLLEILEKFTVSNKYVLSTQLYHYEFPEINSKNTVIKLEHSLAYVTESQNLNAIIQHYYHIPSILLKEFNEALYAFRGTSDDREEKLLEFYTKLSGDLNGLKPDSKIEEGHALKFALQLLAYDIIVDEDREVIEEIDVIEDDELKEKLHGRLKTGILRSILYDKDFYQFNYTNGRNYDSEKSERKYFVIKTNLNYGKHSLLVVTLNNQSTNVDVEGIGKKLLDLFIEYGLVS